MREYNEQPMASMYVVTRERVTCETMAEKPTGERKLIHNVMAGVIAVKSTARRGTCSVSRSCHSISSHRENERRYVAESTDPCHELLEEWVIVIANERKHHSAGSRAGIDARHHQDWRNHAEDRAGCSLIASCGIKGELHNDAEGMAGSAEFAVHESAQIATAKSDQDGNDKTREFVGGSGPKQALGQTT